MHGILVELAGIKQGLRSFSKQFLHFQHGIPPDRLILLLQFGYPLNSAGVKHKCVYKKRE